MPIRYANYKSKVFTMIEANYGNYKFFPNEFLHQYKRIYKELVFT